MGDDEPVVLGLSVRLIIAGVSLAHISGGSPILQSEFIYDTAPFPSCHASTIVEVGKDHLIAAWFGGTAESHSDVAIYGSHRLNGMWSPPVKIADGLVGSTPYACYNPVLFQPKKGPVMLFYKYGTGPQTWKGRLVLSHDNGATWSAPTDLPPGVLGPIKNKPIEFHGCILCPSSSEDHGWRVHFEWTRDSGKTWNITPPVNDGRTIGAIQPSILPMGGQWLRAIGRTQQTHLFLIDSHDGGLTWGEMRLIEVANPNSGTDAVRLDDGRFLLVYNDSTSHRTPLSVALSTDGEHWKRVLDLETLSGEYSYPAVIQSVDGMIHITYTWHRQKIRHVVLDPNALRT